MSAVQENLPLILGLALGVLFVLGLALALRTEGGRTSLAAAAVRLAVAALALAERWLGQQVEPVTLSDGKTVFKEGQITLARMQLRTWLARSEDEKG